jgi:putative endonuclease
MAVADLYRRDGFAVERNFRSGRIEVDVIARRPGLIVFVEVKARTSDRFGSPAEAVTPLKQGRIRKAAGAWLAQNGPSRVAVRFDVVSAIVRRGGVELTRIPDAF